MLSALLVVITFASATGLEPPEIVASFESVEACTIAESKYTKQFSEDLKNKGAALACFGLIYPV